MSPLYLIAAGLITLVVGVGAYLLGRRQRPPTAGLATAEMIGRSLPVPEGEQEQYGGFIRDLAAGGTVAGREMRSHRMDGSPIHVQIYASPIRDPSGEIVGYTGLVADIEERTRLEQQLLRSQKMEAVGQLAGGIAHDFNNVLTAIMGYAEGLANQVDADSGVKDSALRILDASERASDLVRQLLAFSRRQVLQPRTLDLRDVIRGTRSMLRPLLGERIGIVIHTGDEPAVVVADPGQLQQVLLNLALNARDAMPDGGTLTLRIRHTTLEPDQATSLQAPGPGEYVVLEVVDIGSGMTDDLQIQIFEPFFTTKPEGTGLGLSTVYGIVSQSGGFLDVHSEAGKGTTFQVYFPHSSDLLADAIPTQPEMPQLVEGQGTVLVVEDEPDLLRIARLILEHSGYRVLSAANAEAALEMVEEGAHPDLLLTDVVLPGRNGVELAQQLLEVLPELRVLYTSGYARDVIGNNRVLHGNTQFLQKPYRPSQLTEEIRRALQTTPPPPPRSRRDKDGTDAS
ncbi:MAG: response regulator [Deltaproteobacteria bacterium]|nr:response regulator [Deltaproteobacteria bacterium]